MANKLLDFIKTRKIAAIIVGTIVLFFVLRLILLQKPNNELTYQVKKEDLVDSVQVSGTYTTASLTQVFSPTKGVVDNLFVTNNEEVRKGQQLFHVQSTATEDQQKAAYSTYASALSALQQAQNAKQSLDAAMWAKQQSYISAQNTQNYKNTHNDNPATKTGYTDLEKQGIDRAVVQTQKDFEAAQQAYKTADVTVNAASAQVATTQSLYQETQSATVTAPIGGKIVNLLVQNGDQVNTGAAVNPTSAPSQITTIGNQSSPVLIIANLDNPIISASISEDYITRISTGQKVYVVFDALRDKTFTGKVENIATVGTTSQGVVSYDARISADNLPVSIKPNMTALITIETLRKNSVIDVPNSAVVSGQDGPYVLEAKTHKKIPVNIGVKGVSKTEIVSGLTEGSVIVASPDIQDK